MRTNVATASLLSAISDAVAQGFEGHERRNRVPAGGDLGGNGGDGATGANGAGLDLFRSASMFAWGGAVNGAAVTVWLGWLERIFPSTNQTLGRLCSKILFNQVCASPWLNGGFFGVATARNHDLTSSAGREQWLAAWGRKIQTDLPSTVCYSFAVWGPAHFVNFLFIPPHVRVLYTNGIFFAWTVFLSSVGYRPVAPQDDGKSFSGKDQQLGPVGVASVSVRGAQEAVGGAP